MGNMSWDEPKAVPVSDWPPPRRWRERDRLGPSEKGRSPEPDKAGQRTDVDEQATDGFPKPPHSVRSPKGRRPL